MEVSKKYNISKFFYASSSSVYGDKNKYPADENDKLYPKNIYGLSKKVNEEYVDMYLDKKTKYIGLRFFTVFGKWGRPDMLILKFLDYAKKNKKFLLNNSGNHWRDFTYIDDVVEILFKLKDVKFKKNQIFNICSNKPIHIKKLMSYLINKTKYKNITNVKHNNYEVFKTHGKNNKILKTVKFKKFSEFYKNVDVTIDWYKYYNNLL